MMHRSKKKKTVQIVKQSPGLLLIEIDLDVRIVYKSIK